MKASVSLPGAFTVVPDDDPGKSIDAKDTASVDFAGSFRVIKLEDKATPAEKTPPKK